MTALLIKIVLAYLLGSLSGGLIVGALRHVDIRTAGSGNTGGTNAFRTQGFRFALAVVVIDIGKGALGAGAVPLLTLPGFADTVRPAVQAVACGGAAILGHCYPLWHGFRGGKGAATAVGAVCVLQPLAVIPLLFAWLVVLGLTGWVGLSTMVAGFSLVPAMIWLGGPEPHVWFAACLAVFLVFTHRSNIRKMLAGQEHSFERAKFRNWFS